MNGYDIILILAIPPTAAGLYAAWQQWKDERLEGRRQVPRFRPRPEAMKFTGPQRRPHRST